VDKEYALNKFYASTDRKVTPLMRSSPLANTFGLPAGKEYSCKDATEWCLSNCYAGKIEQLYSNVRVFLLRNWDVYEANKHSVNGLTDALMPMINKFIDDCERLGVEPVFRWFWDGDIPSRRFARAMQRVSCDERVVSSSVRFWVYTRNFDVIDLLLLPNLTVYLSVDAGNMLKGYKTKRMYTSVKLALCADTWDETEVLADKFEGERRGARCPELTGKIPLVVRGVGACVDCGMCISGVNNVRFASSKK